MRDSFKLQFIVNPSILDLMKIYFKIFCHFLFLGTHSFGGPVAHLGFFHRHFVQKHRWISEEDYQELVALCQILPGPASSQVGMAIGHQRGGVIGALVAWLGFTAPSALLLILFSLGISAIDQQSAKPYIITAKVFTIFIVGHALYKMIVKFCRTRLDWFLCLSSAGAMLLIPHNLTQVALIFLIGVWGAIFGKRYFPYHLALHHHLEAKASEKRLGVFLLIILTILLISSVVLLPLLAPSNVASSLQFFQAGSLVFGGGHVVLPLLSESFVTSGQLSSDQFLSGYAAAQLIPGPLFTISAYLGTTLHGVWGGLLATVAIFLPAFLLIIGVLPFWNQLKKYQRLSYAFKAVNPAVVGLLLAAFINPVIVSVIKSFI